MGDLILAHVCMPGGLDQVWDLPGVEVPHDLEVVAAPVWSGAGRQRPVALMVTETRMQDSRLLKFILLPDGGLPQALPTFNTIVVMAIFHVIVVLNQSL